MIAAGPVWEVIVIHVLSDPVQPRGTYADALDPSAGRSQLLDLGRHVGQLPDSDCGCRPRDGFWSERGGRCPTSGLAFLDARAVTFSNREMDAIVLHELTHVRDSTTSSSFLHAVVRCAFWFHPLVWIVGVRLRQARELAADEPVIVAPPASRVRAATTSSSSVLVCHAACT